MEHVLITNRKTALAFIRKSHQFLLLPKRLWECDVQKCNPTAYHGSRGKAAVSRARKGLKILKKVEKDMEKLIKILS